MRFLALWDPKIRDEMISFVVTARNDNYGGDFLYRMQAFVNVLLTLCERHCLNMELVIAEWNPPEDNPRLAQALKWPASPQYCKVRIIEVPEEVHKQLPKSDRMPLFEFIGKNVGVRRARGEYIIATNPDIIFSEDLISFLASARLLPNYFYRTTRYDVTGTMSLDTSVEEQLAYCRQHIVRVNGYLCSIDYRLSKMLNASRILRSIVGELVWRLQNFSTERPFTNASGDFLMMHREQWHILLGYPQIIGADSHGRFHVDSFMLYIALLHGLKQVRLGNHLRIYHQEHERYTNSEIYSPEVESTQQQLYRARKAVKFNDETWGLGTHELEEIVIS